MASALSGDWLNYLCHPVISQAKVIVSKIMIVVVDYGLGNLGSLLNMLKKIQVPAIASDKIEKINKASKLILPGVGAFDQGVKNINRLGLKKILKEKITQEKIPVLGICLGMQLLTLKSEEGRLPGLGVIRAKTIRFDFPSSQTQLKIPHMGWNNIVPRDKAALFDQLTSEETKFYFVHSYHLVCDDKKNILATTNYGYDFASAIVQDNIMGVQFHPEKSHKFGMKLLANFANLYPVREGRRRRIALENEIL